MVNDLNLFPRLKSTALAAKQPNIESFYHLKEDAIEGKSCCGTACFVARYRDRQKWDRACREDSRVYCLGKCYAAPATGSDETRPNIEAFCATPVLLERTLQGDARHIGKYVGLGGYRGLETALRNGPDVLVREVEVSQLRGRGGAGFPTGKKWHMAAQQRATQKYIVANADEGDPGAYIDRFIIENDPHRLIEGMALTGYAVGATKGYVYIRNEYPEAQRIFQKAVSDARQGGFLSSSHWKFSFDIEIVSGLGSYICGEETALLNSIEGKRPVAMARPPYATEHGLFGKPTVIGNVETLATIPWIVRHSGQAYRAMGFSNSRGTKLLSLNSLFNRPGLYEVEFGISVRDIVEHLGGGLREGTLRGVMIGGPLAGIVPPSLVDTRLGFEELREIGATVGHGGVIAFNEHTSIPELIEYIFSFAAFESCGKCTPCRLGTRRVQRLFEHVLLSHRPLEDSRREWNEIVAALKLTSLCGLGTGVGDFAESISRHYERELNEWLK